MKDFLEEIIESRGANFPKLLEEASLKRELIRTIEKLERVVHKLRRIIGDHFYVLKDANEMYYVGEILCLDRKLGEPEYKYFDNSDTAIQFKKKSDAFEIKRKLLKNGISVKVMKVK